MNNDVGMAFGRRKAATAPDRTAHGAPMVRVPAASNEGAGHQQEDVSA